MRYAFSSLGNWESPKWMGWEKTGKSDGYILDETSGLPVVGESTPEGEK